MDLATGMAPDGVGGSASGTFERRRSRRSATLADNERIRVVLNCIYHMVCFKVNFNKILFKVESLRREELIFDEVSAMFEQQKAKHQSPEHTFSLSRVLSSERSTQARLKNLRKQFITELGFCFK